jgi:Cu2+-containing amine oxidase
MDLKDRIVYDAKNESIYFARYEVQSFLVNQLSSNGEVKPILTLDSVSKFEKIVADRGFIYNIRSKGAVKSIYRIELK